MKYRVIVELDAESLSAANKIMAERLGYDEEYGLGDYQFQGWEVEGGDDE